MTDSYRPYSYLSKFLQKRAVALVDADALQSNFSSLRSAVCKNDPKVTPIAVVKADAYGHGIPLCVPVLLDAGCRAFAVATAEEALAVRKLCDEKSLPTLVLILGWSDPDLVPLLSDFRITQSVLSFEYAKSLSRVAKSVKKPLQVHISLDTGMNRIGLPVKNTADFDDTVEKIKKIFALSFLSVTGVFSHFARADEATPDAVAFSNLQSDRFQKVLFSLSRENVKIPFSHLCNSAAAILRPGDRFDGVRFGLSLYGIPPTENFPVSLSPVLSFWSFVSHLHVMQAGESLGYGGTFTSGSPRRIATVPVGYADGFLRAYKKATLFVDTEKGRFPAPVVGNVCMDQFMLDVTNLPVRIGTPVCIFDSFASLSSLSSLAGSIPYETLCLISPRVERIPVKNSP